MVYVEEKTVKGKRVHVRIADLYEGETYYQVVSVL